MNRLRAAAFVAASCAAAPAGAVVDAVSDLPLCTPEIGAAPLQPGLEFDPVLPTCLDGRTGAFVFVVDVSDFINQLFEGPAAELGQDGLFFDPPIVTGYDYTVDNTTFTTIGAPLAVNDPDGYEIVVGAQSAPLAVGGTLDFSAVFGTNPTAFSLRGIDPTLGLDPDDPIAFPALLNFDLANLTANTFTVTITPQVVPLPAGAALYAGALGLGGLLLRRRARAARG